MPTGDLVRTLLARALGPDRARSAVATLGKRLRAPDPDEAAAPSGGGDDAAPSPRDTATSAATAIDADINSIDPAARRINIGGGRWQHPGWENVDHYVTGPQVQYRIDLRENQRLPLPDGSCRLVFTSHILEHMDDAAAASVLREARRLLAPDGTLRISVPDARRAIEAYEGDDELFFTKGGVNCLGPTMEHKLVNFFASYRHEGYTGGPLVDPADVRAALSEHDLPGFVSWCVERIPAEAGYRAHVNGYDFPKLAGMLRDAGFDTVVRSAWRSSRVPELRHENFDNRPVVSLFVEAY